MTKHSVQEPSEPAFISSADCTDCGCGLPPLAPPMPVAPRRPKRLLTRRSAFTLAAQAGAVSLLAACAPKTTVAPPGVGADTSPADASSPAERKRGLQRIDLAFCSQLLCILPYEVARERGFFDAEGLYVNLVYMQGGAQAMNALLSNKLDWIGTPMDLVVQAAAQGSAVQMLTSTARLPFFALVSSPLAAGINEVQDLVGKKVGVAARGTADDFLARFIIKRSGVDPDQVQWVELGTNLYDGLLSGQVQAGMVQEPSLTLLQKVGGNALVNFMTLKDARAWLGSAYQFMGLSTRADVLDKQGDIAAKLVRALVKANQWIVANSGKRVIEAAPPEIVSGGHVQTFAAAVDRYKADLYPADGKLDVTAVQAVIDVQRASGALSADTGLKAEDLFTNQFLAN